MRVRLVTVVILVGLLPACHVRRSSISHRTAPNPTGCFIEVFAKEGFEGPRDFINGPAKHWKLDELPFDANWHRRIRSLRVGPSATVTVWTREGFEGESLRFGPDRNHPRMIEEFSGKVASLQIGCNQPAAE